MTALSELKPLRRDRIMDVVHAAGIDIPDWVNSKLGPSNPKYCYEWAFADEDRRTIVLCLWFEDCEKDEGGAIVQRGNIRPLILQLEGQSSPRARRARQFDMLLQDARRLNSTIRVALVDRSDAAKGGDDEDASHAAFRQLDPAVWRLDHYDLMTGDYTLRRETPAASSEASADSSGANSLRAENGPENQPDRRVGAGVGAVRQMDYVCRIVYSDNGWVRPATAFREAPDSFASSRGFGHEEWLFRDEWAIGGWRYAFLQGVNDSYERLCRENVPFDVTLFTMDPNAGHRYVARLFGVEVLIPEVAQEAVEEFRRRGWFDAMRAEIAAVGGQETALGDDVLAKHVLNMRFRPDRVERLRGMPVAQEGDPVRRIRRYTLCSSIKVGVEDESGEASGREPTTAAYFRNGTEPSWITPEHGLMQMALREELSVEFPDAQIRCEVDGVDVLLETHEERILFEVKSDLCARRAIRAAIGQVLEYAYYRDQDEERAVRLVIVGRGAATSEDVDYLALLKQKFGIPIQYRQVLPGPRPQS